jgi:hypothetical protein
MLPPGLENPPNTTSLSHPALARGAILDVSKIGVDPAAISGYRWRRQSDR